MYPESSISLSKAQAESSSSTPTENKATRRPRRSAKQTLPDWKTLASETPRPGIRTFAINADIARAIAARSKQSAKPTQTGGEVTGA